MSKCRIGEGETSVDLDVGKLLQSALFLVWAGYLLLIYFAFFLLLSFPFPESFLDFFRIFVSLDLYSPHSLS